MAFSTKVDALLQSKVAAQAEGISPRHRSIVHTALRMVVFLTRSIGTVEYYRGVRAKSSAP
jgi:hypothetical protein